jgi:hypothetical protein
MKETEREKRSKRDFRLLDRFLIAIFTVTGTIAMCGVIFEGARRQWINVAISAGIVAVSIYDLLKNE